jgi:outer membrane protein assembly factor BamB
MTVRRIRLALPLLVLLLASPALAQRADSPFLFGRPWAVADSSEVQHQLDRVREAAEAGDWDKAAGPLQHILDYYPDHVVRIGEESYVGAREHVLRMLAEWPRAGRDAYRRLVDPRARQLLERGIEERDADLLRRVWMTFPISAHAAAAADAEALLRLAAGDLDRTARILRLLLADEIPHELPRGVLRARLAFVLGRLGEPDAIRDLVAEQRRDDPDEAVEQGGRVRRASEAIEDALAHAAPPRPLTGWPHYGGSEDRRRSQGPGADVGPLQWDLEDLRMVPRSLDFQQGDRPTSGGWPERLERWFPIHPVLGGGKLVFHNGNLVQARDAYTGALLWQYPERVPPTGNRGRTNFGTVYGASIGGQAVYLNLEVPGRPPRTNNLTYQNQPIIYPIPERRLFALDLSTGERLWSHEPSRIRDWPEAEFLSTTTVDTPPLAIGDLLYVPMTRFEGRYHAFLCAFDRHTGRLRWKRRLCIAQMEVNLFGRPVKEAAPSAVSSDGRNLFVCTNLGVVACVDGWTGLIRWIRGYPQVEIPFSRLWYRVDERRPTWTNAAPIVLDDLVLLTPTDSRHLLALSREDGRTRWRFDGGGVARGGELLVELLGTDDRHAYVAGTTVYAIDHRNGKLRWEGVLSSGETAAGRGAVVGDAVLCPTPEALYAFRTRNGRLAWRREWEELDGTAFPAGGNLLVREGVAVVSGRRTIEVFYDWASIFKRLSEEVRRVPNDPTLRLRAGRIFLRGGRLEEAEASFVEARRIAASRSDDIARELALEARRGLHEVRMVRAHVSADEGDVDRARSVLRRALAEAPDAAARVEVHLLLVRLAEEKGEIGAAVALLRAMERTDGEAVVPFEDERKRTVGAVALLRAAHLNVSAGRHDEAVRDLQGVIDKYAEEPYEDSEAGLVARRAIEELIRAHGRGVYAGPDRAARTALDRALRGSGESELLEVHRKYPNSLAAPEALVELARRRLAAGDPARASEFLRRRIRLGGSPEDLAAALLMLVRCDEKRERYASAVTSLRRLADRYPDVILTLNGDRRRVREVVEAELAREVFQRVVTLVSVPELRLPLAARWRLDDGERSMTQMIRPRGVLPVGADEKVFVLSDTVLAARHAADGRVIWSRNVAARARAEAYFCDGVLVLPTDEDLRAFDPATGEALWTYAPGRPFRAVRASEDVVCALLGSHEDRNERLLVAIGPDGEMRWQRNLEGKPDDRFLLSSETALVLTTEPFAMQAYDLLTGRRRTESPLGDGFFRDPVLLDRMRVLLVKGSRGLEVLDLAGERRVWSRDLSEGSFLRAVLPLGDEVLVSDMSDTLLLLRADDGQEIWSRPPPRGLNLAYQGEVADDEHVYVLDRDPDGRYAARAMRRSDGSTAWSTPLLEARSAQIQPMVTRDHVIYHANRYQLGRNSWSSSTFFLDRRTGRVVQKLEVPEVQNAYSYAVLDRGRLGFYSRGRLVLFSPD